MSNPKKIRPASPSRLRRIRRKHSKLRRQQDNDPKSMQLVMGISGGIILLFVVGLGLWWQFLPEPRRPHGYNIPGSLEELLRIPEDKLDLGMACLFIAREDMQRSFGRDFSILAQLQKIDQMAAELQARINDEMAPSEVIKTIAHYLYEEQHFTTSQNLWDPSNLYLNLIFEGKQGYCLGFTELWLALAERIYWRRRYLPIYAVLVPRHVFCRWDGCGHYQNIETLHTDPPVLGFEFIMSRIMPSKRFYRAGRNIPDDVYRRRYQILPQAIKNGVYLKNLKKRKFISLIYGNRTFLELFKLRYVHDPSKWEKQLQRAEEDNRKAMQCDRQEIQHYYNRAYLHLYHGRYQRALQDMFYYKRYNPSSSCLILISRIYMALGQYAKVQESLEQICDSPDITMVIQPLAYVQTEWRYHTKEWQKGLALVKELIAKSEPGPFQNCLAPWHIALYNKLGRYREALEAANYHLSYAGRKGAVHASLAITYLQQGKRVQALQEIKQALWHDQQEVWALNAMGLYYLQEKDLANARKYFQLATKFDPLFREARINLQKLNQGR